MFTRCMNHLLTPKLIFSIYTLNVFIGPLTSLANTLTYSFSIGKNTSEKCFFHYSCKVRACNVNEIRNENVDVENAIII